MTIPSRYSVIHCTSSFSQHLPNIHVHVFFFRFSVTFVVPIHKCCGPEIHRMIALVNWWQDVGKIKLYQCSREPLSEIILYLHKSLYVQWRVTESNCSHLGCCNLLASHLKPSNIFLLVSTDLIRVADLDEGSFVNCLQIFKAIL